MNILIDAYRDRMLIEAPTDLFNPPINERAILRRIRYNLTGQAKCWNCQKWVLHDKNGCCPECDEVEIPF